MVKQEREEEMETSYIVARISRKHVVKYGLPRLKPDYKILGWDNKSEHLLIGKEWGKWQHQNRH